MDDVALQAFKCKWIICILATGASYHVYGSHQLRPFFSHSLLLTAENICHLFVPLQLFQTPFSMLKMEGSALKMSSLLKSAQLIVQCRVM